MDVMLPERLITFYGNKLTSWYGLLAKLNVELTVWNVRST